jgi:hypothetical protein
MIGVGIAFIVVGILFLFIVPWVGIAAGIVGLVLAILWVAGFVRPAQSRATCIRTGTASEACVCSRDNKCGDFVTAPATM